MSDVQLYLFEADKDRAEATRLAGVAAKSEAIRRPWLDNLANRCPELESKQLKLIDLVQSLGEYLNNDDPGLRTKSTGELDSIRPGQD